MKSWLPYSLLAALSWGSYIVVAKITTSNKYCGLSQKWALLLMFGGIGTVFTLYWLLTATDKPDLNPSSVLAGIVSGALWALGMIFSIYALKKGADVARLVPICNSNTLVAVLLGIFFLREIPDASGILRVIIGGILILLGGILVL